MVRKYFTSSLLPTNYYILNIAVYNQLKTSDIPPKDFFHLIYHCVTVAVNRLYFPVCAQLLPEQSERSLPEG